MQAQNTFNEGMVLDNHPLMTPNTVLTDALNATLVTMNGNEMVLQNDMGNARVENAKLPPGYVPIGMKEYGGIIYIACYNPLTNKGQIGCFPSPQRQKTATQISKITPTFEFPDVTQISGNDYNINSTLIKCEIFPNETIIRSGDKFSVGLPLDKIFGYNAAAYVSNYNNIVNGLVATPMNRMYTFGIATLDNNGQLRDITSQLKRYDQNGAQIQFTNIDSDLYKFNSGYWQNEVTAQTEDGIVSSELMTQTNIQSKLNTYNSKLFGRLFLYAKHNIIDNVDISVVGYKRLEGNLENEEQSIKNPIYKGKDNNNKDILISTDMILLIYANYKYNCPDGSSALNNQNLAIPQEGYKYYFDRDSINTIQGLKLNLTIGSSPAKSSLLQFNIPNSDWKNYTTGYGYPIYDPVTNLYSFSQLYTIPINISTENHKINWELTPVMNFYNNNRMCTGYLPSKKVVGELDADNLNSGTMKLNTWNYYVSDSRVHLRWGYESYPRTNDIISDVKFEFTDISQNTGNTPRWTYVTKNRLSYNGTFSESFDINNFISDKPSKNVFAPNKIFEVKISYKYNNSDRADYRWLVLTGLYNTSYWGTEEYPSIQDYGDFLKCYYILNGKYYIFNYGRNELNLNIVTQEGHSVVTQEGHNVGGMQYVENKYGTWREVTKDNIEGKQRIPESYFNISVTASLKSVNSTSIILGNTGNYISSTLEGAPKHINESYKVTGNIVSTVTLNNDDTHALNISKWIPNITNSTVTHDANISYVGEVPEENKLKIAPKVTIKKDKNIITTIYKDSVFNTLLGGSTGKCNMKVLSSLSTLGELNTIGSGNGMLEHSYAVHTELDTRGKCDFKVDIWPILSSQSYSKLEELIVAQWGNNSTEHGNALINYSGRIYSNRGDRYVNVNSSFKEQFDKLPKNYNIIVLTSLARNYIGEITGSNANTSVTTLKQSGSMQYDTNDNRDTQEYPGNILVLIRSITGEFTLVDYCRWTPNDNINEVWKQFITDNISKYNYYNPENTQNLYSIMDNYYYNNKYDVYADCTIEVFATEEDLKNYTSILNSYAARANGNLLAVNIDLTNIKAKNFVCTIPSSKHLIAELQDNNAIAYIGQNSNKEPIILQQDNNGNPIKENLVYYYDNNELKIQNQLKIQDNKLYTYNVGTKLGIYPQVGWSTKSGHSHLTATLGGISLIDLAKGTFNHIGSL